MTLICYVGKVGSGKTLSAIRQTYNYFLSGSEVFSNIKLNFPYTPLTLDLIRSYASDTHRFKNAVFLIDEAHILFDSREAMSKKNKEIINLIGLQSRKKNIKTIITTQNFRQVDVRFRNIVDYVIVCTSKFHGDEHYVTLDYQYEDEFGYMQKYRYRFKGKPYYDLYDTYEVVKPL